MADILLGTSGWTYDDWWGRLYPPDLSPRLRLEHYAQEFRTVELNASHYRWPRDATFAGWRRRLPEGFEMTVKAPKALTHNTTLFRPDRWCDIIERSLHELRGRRGPLLLQLPPSLARDDDRLDYALGRLPGWLRLAVELRHDSWVHDDVFALLERRRTAYVVMSGAGLPCVLRATAPLVYIRWHGPSHDHLYAGSYDDDSMQWWAERIREWQRAGHDVRGYFNNDGNGYAVDNVRHLRHLLGC